MSEYANMRFELKNTKLYLSNPSMKKPIYSRFSKSKPKVLDVSTPAAKINKSR